MIPKSPCGNCDKKGCGAYHDQCAKYQEFKNMLDTQRKIINEAREKEQPIIRKGRVRK